MKLSAETLLFIEEHLNDDVRILALKATKQAGVDLPAALTQIAGHQAATDKLPAWSRTKGILYPKHLSMEQCSSEVTARYKASLVSGITFADLTGGFGIDCYFLSTRFQRSAYIERQEELCEIARHNFTLLNSEDITVYHADGTEYLQHMEPVDCLFIDPARRDTHGGKTVAIADCEPNICALEELLLQKASTVLVKLSPMLDISQALRDLYSVRSVHIISVHNECKELLLLLSKKAVEEGIKLHCVNLLTQSLRENRESANKETLLSQTPCTKPLQQTREKSLQDTKNNHFIEEFPLSTESAIQPINEVAISSKEISGTLPPTYSEFIFSPEEEANASCPYTDSAEKYLYEPNASIMKAGGYRSLAQRYNLQKLHPNSHLYTSSHYLADFPGRRFKIEQVWGFNKKELKELSSLKQANLTIRNFPASISELRKRLKLKDGGNIYLFATTFSDGRKAIIQSRKA